MEDEEEESQDQDESSSRPPATKTALNSNRFKGGSRLIKPNKRLISDEENEQQSEDEKQSEVEPPKK